MTLQDFNHLIRKRIQEGTFHVHGHVRQDILDTFRSNSKNLKDEFFEDAERCLVQNQVPNPIMLTVYPFDEEVDKSRFQTLVIRAIEKLENAHGELDVQKLANYIWGLLDYMLHDWVISDFQALVTRLRECKNRLKQMESSNAADFSSLDEMLGHFVKES